MLNGICEVLVENRPGFIDNNKVLKYQLVGFHFVIFQ
jgi:hypothetical protein